MTDFFESPGDAIDPDKFNENPVAQDVQQLPQMTQQRNVQTIDQRLAELKESVRHFKNVVNSEKVPLLRNDTNSIINSLLEQLTVTNTDEALLAMKLKQQSAAAGTSNVTVELNFSQPNADAQQQWQQLESRVAFVEQIVGTVQERRQALLYDQNVRVQIQQLGETLKDYKEQQVEYKEAVQSAFKKIQELSSQNLDPDQIYQLNLIYQRVQRLQSLSDYLPKLVQRLEFLRDAHQKSVGINQQFESLVSSHKEVMLLIQQGEQKVAQVKDKMVNQYGSILKKLAEFDSKFQR